MKATTLEEAHTAGYQLGMVAQMESLVLIYKEKAGKAFAIGQRNAADLLMETAKDIDKSAQIMRKKYMEEYH